MTTQKQGLNELHELMCFFLAADTEIRERNKGTIYIS